MDMEKPIGGRPFVGLGDAARGQIRGGEVLLFLRRLSTATKSSIKTSAIIARYQSGNEDEEPDEVLDDSFESERMVTVSSLGFVTKSSPFAESYAISKGPGPAAFVATTVLFASETAETVGPENSATNISPFAES
jgi:hypothetical protein